MVCPVDLTAFLAFGQRIGKTAQVAGGHVDLFYPDCGALYLAEALPDDEEFSPQVFDLSLERCS